MHCLRDVGDDLLIWQMDEIEAVGGSSRAGAGEGGGAGSPAAFAIPIVVLVIIHAIVFKVIPSPF